ncbi:Protein charlatan [Frankliniella fusca]|uniref:Protein charlatan n=1 Tax=Frankliniella fusca TaxID=407009 RepID=A0AAE1HXS6_9NEOP|nr:Protein charlatan [Frankliniella fusca]
MASNPFSYGEHQIVHKKVKNFSFPCVACEERFNTAGAFNVHFTRCHREKSNNDSTPSTSSSNLGVLSAATFRTFGDVLIASSFTCNVTTCGEDLRTACGLRKHMADHIKKGYIIQCPFGDCPDRPMNKILKFTKVTTFRAHMSQYHNEPKEHPLLRTDCVAGVSYQESDDEDFDKLDSNNGDGDGAADCVKVSSCENNAPQQHDKPYFQDNIYPENMVRDYIGKFYLWLEGQLLISSSKVQSISEELATLCELSHHRLKAAMQEELVKAGLTKEKTDEVIEKVLKKDTVHAVHHKGADVVDMTTKHM